MAELITDQELEILQKRAKKRFVILLVTIVITFFLFLILGMLALMYNGDSFFYSLLCVLFADVTVHCVIGGVFYVLIVQKSYDKFNNTFKNKYVLKTIEDTGLFEDLDYNITGGFTHDNIRNSAVINCADKKYFLSEDMLSGRYKSVEFYISDVTTRKLVVQNKKSRIDTVFNGQVLCFTTFDDVKASDEFLQVFEKEFLSDVKGWTAKHKIETENEKFNKKYQVYADDEHNAFYILTPQLMEKILKFSESIGEQISISFYGKRMYVAINRFGSMFDGKIDVPIAQQKQLILDDIKLLQKAADILIQKRYEDLNRAEKA